ncbi:MAG: vanadium-dependent haloperoxidase [Ginsengibacter sp.]
MTRLRNISGVIAFLFCCTSLAAHAKPVTFSTNDYVAALKKVTDVMVNDVTSPVAASRYYAYINVASEEMIALQKGNKALSFEGKLNGFQGVKTTNKILPENFSFSIILTVFRMGQRLLPSGYLLKQQADSFLLLAQKRGLKKEQIQQVDNIVSELVKQIFSYSKKDGFFKLNNLPRYTPTNGDAWWQPTPPTFISPVEPYWNTLRTFLLDSAQQYKPAAPALYDTSRTSSFYSQLKEVYDIGKKHDPKQAATAMFWDCNPFAVQQIGHVEFGLKKISPAGHWIGITGIACRKEKYGLEKTVLIHALVSIGLADAIIACWDEKYRSNRVRPETVINRIIDPHWRPLLQTPPFPEYVSGHSVTSTAAAVILTKIFSDNFSYSDDTEVEFGLPIRKFHSFFSASQEAAISRMYGGIHYRDAIDNGISQGRKVGEFVNQKLSSYFELLKNK